MEYEEVLSFVDGMILDEGAEDDPVKQAKVFKFIRHEIDNARDGLDRADRAMVEVATQLSSAWYRDVPQECLVSEDETMDYHRRIAYALENLDGFEYHLDTVEQEYGKVIESKE